MNASRVTHTSLLALSQLVTQIQGLGLYFKAISGLNWQLYQTLILHLGATVTAIFLWDKAVQKALERAHESWRQRIFSLEVSQPTKQSLGEQGTLKTQPPLENTANFSCWQVFLAWVLPVNIPFYSQLCYLYWFCEKYSTSTNDSITKSKDRIFFSVTPTKMYTHFAFLFLYSCLMWMNKNNVKQLLW